MNTRWIADVVYDLIKDYGAEIHYITVGANSVLNETTGRTDRQKTVSTLTVAIAPQQLVRKFAQDIGYLAANKNFTYGGLNDFNSLVIIVQGEDVTFDPNLDGYVVFENERYSKADMTRIADGVAYLFRLKRVEGDLPYDIKALLIRESLAFEEGGVNELT